MQAGPFCADHDDEASDLADHLSAESSSDSGAHSEEDSHSGSDSHEHHVFTASEDSLPSAESLEAVLECSLSEGEVAALEVSSESSDRDWSFLQLYIETCDL